MLVSYSYGGPGMEGLEHTFHHPASFAYRESVGWERGQ